ncbi:MAG: hypothetical protein OXR73_28170 [Myxococcales bacterium]|nr:hypothetical protein [Myxococcales bacterium]
MRKSTSCDSFRQKMLDISRQVTRSIAVLLLAAGCTPSEDGADTRMPGADAEDGGTDSGQSRAAEGDEDRGEVDAGEDGGCTPEARECDGDVARVCASDGSRWNSLRCAGGCEAGECAPLSLETGWSVHQYRLTDDSIKTEARYSFDMDGLIATQSANPMPSVYYNDTSLPEGIRVSGSFGVHATQDDDLIGFVFGWQDAQRFYLFDWKQATQDDPCGLAEVGAALKVVQASSPLESCEDFWTSAGTEHVTTLVGNEQNPTGWQDHTVYELVLEFRPGDIHVQILQGTEVVVDIRSDDTTFRSGKFGFFNYSQEAVRYELFSISPI